MQLSGWENLSSYVEQLNAQGGAYVKLSNDGDKVVGVFCGDPYGRRLAWMGDRYEDYDENDPLHRGIKPSLRIAVNFYVPDEHAMKIFEGTSAWFQDVIRVRKKYAGQSWVFEIQRHGKKGDPNTKYSILPDAPVTPQLQQEIDACAMHDLMNRNGGTRESDRAAEVQRAAGGFKPDESGGVGELSPEEPISREVALDLVGALRDLPQVFVSEFLQRFGIERVRQLKCKDLSAARTTIADMKMRGPEADPFA